jgi:hypothetical protein
MPGKPSGNRRAAKRFAGLVHQIHVVMVFGPVVADEDHQYPPPTVVVDSR